MEPSVAISGIKYQDAFVHAIQCLFDILFCKEGVGGGFECYVN